MQLQYDEELGERQMDAYLASQVAGSVYAKAGRAMESDPSPESVQVADTARAILVAALRHAADALEEGFPFSAVHAKH